MNLALLLLLPALLAGGAALLLELVWLQRAGAALPGTAPAAALVVPAVLLAWAAGSWVGGRRADGPRARLTRAAWWLAGAALAVGLAPALLGLVVPDATHVGPWWSRALAGGLPVAPAAFALGGVVPWFTRLRAQAGCAPVRAAAGSAGAVALGGAAAAHALGSGALLGVLDPLALATTLLAAAALVVLLLRAAVHAGAAAGFDALADEGAPAARAPGVAPGADEPAPPTAAPAPASPAAAAREDARPWWLVALVGGAVLVGGQVLLLRVLAQSRGDSLSTSAGLLGAVHLGMAAGAALLVPLARVAGPGARGTLLLALGSLALLAPAWGLDAGAAASWRLGLPLGLGCGALLVAAADLQPRGAARLGSWIGDLGAAATLGGVIGGVLVGAVLLPAPWGGTTLGLRLLPGALLLAALLLALWAPGARARLARALAPLAAGALLLVTPAWQAPWRTAPDVTELLMRREGAHGIVSLVRTASGSERLLVDGRFGLGGGGAGALLEQRLGRLAAALAPEARRALLLGVGRGHTLTGLASTTGARVDAVERNAEVLALNLGVPRLAGAVAPPPPPAVHHADARAWLAAHPDTYDLVVGDLFHPWVSGAGTLLAREHFLQVRAALADDGVYVQWLPLHQLPWPAFAAVSRAFLSAFPAARVLLASPLADTPLVALVGGLREGLPAGGQVDALLAVAPSLAGPNAMADVYDAFLADAWRLERAVGEGPVNSFEQPWSEWLSQRRQGDEAAIAARNLRRLALLATPLATSSLRAPPREEPVRKALGKELQARSAALEALLHVRAELADLRAPERLAAPPAWRADRERQVALRLARAWRVFPGHLDLRRVVVEHVEQLRAEGRPDAAAVLLAELLAVQGDAVLGALLGTVLLQLERPDDALHVLRQAVALAPEDPALRLQLARAELESARYDDARDTLLRARALLTRTPLPAPPAAALGLLEGRRGARLEAERVLAALPPGHGWARALRRLVERES